MKNPQDILKNASGRVTALVDDVIPPPGHLPFNSERLEVTISPTLGISGFAAEGDGRQINFFFMKRYEDGEYEIRMSQGVAWCRYVSKNYYYGESGILRLKVAEMGTHYSGGIEKIGFYVDEVNGPGQCTITASFDVRINL